MKFYVMIFMLCTIKHIDLAKSEFFFNFKIYIKKIIGCKIFVGNLEYKMSLNK